MERKIGEQFEYEGVKLEVVENGSQNCDGCYFCDDMFCRIDEEIVDNTGMCSATKRDDKKEVIFKKLE